MCNHSHNYSNVTSFYPFICFFSPRLYCAFVLLPELCVSASVSLYLVCSTSCVLHRPETVKLSRYSNSEELYWPESFKTRLCQETVKIFSVRRVSFTWLQQQCVQSLLGDKAMMSPWETRCGLIRSDYHYLSVAKTSVITILSNSSLPPACCFILTRGGLW